MRTIFTIIALAINVLMFVSASSEIVTNNNKDKWESAACSMILIGTGISVILFLTSLRGEINVTGISNGFTSVDIGRAD